jgi:hypothetical protein
MEKFIGKVVDSMREYQRENDIKNQCITNCQFFYDTIVYTFKNIKDRVKVKPVVFVSLSKQIFIIHMVIEFDDFIIDPSYETFSVEDREYYSSIGDIKSIFNHIDGGLTHRECIEIFLKFVSYAEQMNNNDTCLVACKDFYNKQADYISQVMSK